MKVKVLYYELKEKEFTTKKSLKDFFRGKLENEILRVLTIKKDIFYTQKLPDFFNEIKYGKDK